MTVSASGMKFLINTAEADQSRFNQDILEYIFFFFHYSGFLSSFEKSRVQEQEAMTHTEENIISLLELCSRVRRNRRQGSNRHRRNVEEN